MILKHHKQLITGDMMPVLKVVFILLLNCHLLYGSAISMGGDHEHGDDHAAQMNDHWEAKKWEMARKIDGIKEKITKFKLNFIAKKIEKFLPVQKGKVFIFYFNKFQNS
jgi:hypothetical protein